MALSMTGYGRSEKILNGRDIKVEIKSVNSRYFEYSSRMPRAFAFLDDKIKKEISGTVSRGKIELNLQVQSVSAQDVTITPNIPLAQGYLEAMREIAGNFCIDDDITASALARFGDIFTVTAAAQDEEQLWQDIKEVADEAIKNFVEMRRTEGEKLKEDILSRLNTIEAAVLKIEENSAERVKKYTDKLYQKLKLLLEDRNIDDARILTEAAIFADKTAIDEETVRLHSHIKQYRGILNTPEAVGRKLDFLTQELNRETNTIGSKCQDLDITRIVVDVKAEIEKIREQVQNIE